MPPASHRRRLCQRMGAAFRHPALAVVAILVWLLGVELGPGLHIARHAALGHHHHGAAEIQACTGAEHHDRDHHHDAAEHAEHHQHESAHHQHESAHHQHESAHHQHESAHHQRSEHAHGSAHHEHAQRSAHHEHESDDAPAPEHDEAHDAGGAPHGAHSLAHRELVPLTPPLALPPVLSAPWRRLAASVTVRVAPRDRTPTTLRARGPPRSARVTEPPSIA